MIWIKIRFPVHLLGGLKKSLLGSDLRFAQGKVVSFKGPPRFCAGFSPERRVACRSKRI